jgi:hypothetical protein
MKQRNEEGGTPVGAYAGGRSGVDARALLSRNVRTTARRSIADRPDDLEHTSRADAPMAGA